MNAIARNDDAPDWDDAKEAGYDDLNDAVRCKSFLAQFEMTDDFDIELSNAMLKAPYLAYCKAFADYVESCSRAGDDWSANDFIGLHDGKTDYKALAQVIAGMYGSKLYNAYSEFVEIALNKEAEDAHDSWLVASYEDAA